MHTNIYTHTCKGRYSTTKCVCFCQESYKFNSAFIGFKAPSGYLEDGNPPNNLISDLLACLPVDALFLLQLNVLSHSPSAVLFSFILHNLTHIFLTAFSFFLCLCSHISLFPSFYFPYFLSVARVLSSSAPITHAHWSKAADWGPYMAG